MRRSLQLPVRLPFVAALGLGLLLGISHAAEVKTDLDADINQDGVIDNDDPADNGKAQNRPPGLRIPLGTFQRLVLRCEPKTLDRGYVRLTVVSNPGEWSRLQDPKWAAIPRRPEGAHVRVWKDPDKKELLLDSHDPSKQTCLWRLSYRSPMAFVPKTLYAEGVALSKEDGDVVFALLYSKTSRVSATSPTRDVLVATVTKPAQPRDITRDDPAERKETSVDLVADISGDGTIDPEYPRDNGEVENKPPGLPVTIGELRRLSLRCVPQSPTVGYVRFTVMSGPGEWENQQDPEQPPFGRRPGGGHLRVWGDPNRTELVLETYAYDKTMIVWMLSEQFPIDQVPTTFYLEGMEPSKEDGDVILVLDYGLELKPDEAGITKDVLVLTVKPGDMRADLVADISGDSAIDPDDPNDNGDVEAKPPGLSVQAGKLEQVSLRCVPQSPTIGYVRLAAMSGAGEWEHQQDPTKPPFRRRAAGGRIRVWADAEQTQLILDSHVNEDMILVWTLSEQFAISHIPTCLYVEGMEPSREDGDVILVLDYGPELKPDEAGPRKDVLVLTVEASPVAADLVADISGDGTIDPDDPADNGEVEDKPPGLKLKPGELNELSLRCVPQSPTMGYVRFTVMSGPGEWENQQDPKAAPFGRRPGGGHVRVWGDPERTQLILETYTYDNTMKTWTLSDDHPIGEVPTTLYVEGVAASREDGDVILVLDYGLELKPDEAGIRKDVLVLTVEPATMSTDLVADISGNGTIDPDDPNDNGEVEDRPPGLRLAVGQVTPVSVRCVPQSPTVGYIRFTIMSGAGEWEHLRDPERLPRPRRPAGGRVRVWQDPRRTTLILDSHVLGKMMVVWKLSEEFPFDLVPTTVYVEAVAASRADGDVCLILGEGLEPVNDKPDLEQDILVLTASP